MTKEMIQLLNQLADWQMKQVKQYLMTVKRMEQAEY